MSSESSHAIRHDDVKIPMRDGIRLSANVFVPKEGSSFPVILSRTPYNAGQIEQADEWVLRGYAVVYQDTRGRFRSEGEDRPWLGEKDDAEDTLNWLVQQPWCNGQVGMYGGSYPGFTQVAAARTGHPALKAITPALIGAERYSFNYWGGALRHGRRTRWLLRVPQEFDAERFQNHLPLKTLDLLVHGKINPLWREVLENPVYNRFWQHDSLSEDVARLKAPAFIRTGWFDLFICDTFSLFEHFRYHAPDEETRRRTRMIIGPWPHDINNTKYDELDFGDAGKIPDLFEQEQRFLDHHLKGTPDPTPAPIQLFVMGANCWRYENEWPLARTRWTRLYLAGGGRANTAGGDGLLAERPSGTPDHFTYDPMNPVPTHGGAWCFTNVGLKDQRALEKRSDVLVYTSAPLPEPLEVTGPVSAELYISSSAPDTDFTLKLVDVAPDGTALGITDGIVRVRYRNGVPEGELLKPGEVVRVTIECPPTSYLFRKGHRIRVDISSSNFPAFSRNLNTGLPIGEECTPVIAHQTVYHNEQYPSHVLLPVIPNLA